MEIFKTRLFFDGFVGHDDGEEFQVDTIELSGNFWLVATWLLDKSTGARTPERLVSMPRRSFQETGDPRCRFQMTNSVPKAVFDGEPQGEFVVGYYSVLAHIPAPTHKKPH